MYYEDAVGEWEAPPESTKEGLPIPNEEYIKNVRDNCLLKLPNLTTQKENDRIMVMVCGGSSAKFYLEEIRQKSHDDRYRIFTSNMTHDWLIANGIVPHYQFIIDPKLSKVEDVQHPHKDVKYLLGISCNPAVFKALEGYDVTRVFSVSGIGIPTDVQVIKALLPYEDISLLTGGTMAGLRAMVLADIFGYLTVEYYGFDSCYFEYDDKGDPIYYSYEKVRKENILEAQTDDGRIFLTSPVFASQARQFLKWKHRLEWINFIIHGDSLASHINKLDNEKLKSKHNLLITDYYRELNREMHNHDKGNGDNTYGISGRKYAGDIAVLAGQLIKKYGDLTLLDYGCGKRTLESALPPISGLTVKNYDPCIEGLDSIPEPSDVVACTDVLEHIEPECLENVLDDLKRVTKKLAYVVISTRKARKSYSDGQNTHKIIESHEWWSPKLKKRFFITETQTIPNDKFIYVLQAKEIR